MGVSTRQPSGQKTAQPSLGRPPSDGAGALEEAVTGGGGGGQFGQSTARNDLLVHVLVVHGDIHDLLDQGLLTKLNL